MHIFSIYDSKAQVYGTPWFQPSDIVAIRTFKMEVNRPDHANTVYQNPEDFTLYALGEFNPQTGQIQATEPRLLITAKKVKEK